MNIIIKYTIRFFFSFIFLCATFFRSNGNSDKADSLFASGNYFEASIEYERLVFMSKDQGEIYVNKFRKALCYKQNQEFGNAIDELQQMYFTHPEDSLFQKVCYELAVCFYLNQEPAKALWKIDEYFHRSKDSTSFIHFMPIKILSLNATCQWGEAEKCFIGFIAMENFSAMQKEEMCSKIHQLYHKPPHIRSVKKAENLSRFFPGTGQIYAGKTGEGVVNFLINASLLAFSAHQFYHGFYITGYFVGLGFLNKMYQGGIKRSGILASQKNEKLLSQFNLKSNRIILSDFMVK